MIDHNNHCWIQVSAGLGPDECAFFVTKIIKKILDEARNCDLSAELIEAKEAEEAGTFISALISLSGIGINVFAARWKGSIQWICQSPFRKNHKRKNWYIGVEVLDSPKQDNLSLEIKDVVFETMRATGPGGQHVNKTESAVRATHKPTGLTTVAREERSQHMNKRFALAKLSLALQQIKHKSIAEQDHSRWQKHTQLERGNPTRVFTGVDFQELIKNR